MAGHVERAIREHVAPGESLRTPTGSATFVVHELNETGVVLLLGDKETRTTLSWECLEGITEFLPSYDWLPVGANRDPAGNRRTLDEYLKQCVKRQTANYVAVVLEQADLVELDRTRPARVRLKTSA
jgi:hypothetical protein